MGTGRLAALPRHMRHLSKTRPALLFPHTTLLSANYRVRYSSHSPPAASSTPARQKTTIQTLRTLYQRGEPITVLTAHDFPSGHVADEAGIEVVLVGDSLAMVALGMEDANLVTIEEMLVHCQSVSRAVRHSFIVRPLPIGSSSTIV